MKSHFASDEIQIWGFDGDTIVFEDASLGFGCKLTPVDVNFKSEEEKNQFAVTLMQLLNGLPVGIDFQIICDTKHGHQSIFDEFRGTAADAPVLAKRLAQDRVQMYEYMDRAGLIPRFDIYVFVRRAFSQPLIKKGKFKLTPTKFPEIANERFERERVDFERLKASVIDAIKSTGIQVATLTSSEIYSLVFDQWNPDRSGEEKSYDPEYVRDLVVLSDVMIEPTQFRIGTYRHRIVSLKLLPEATYSCMAAALQRLPFGARVFLTVHIPDQTKELDHLKTQRRMAFSLARGSRSGAHDIESEAKLQDLETLIESLVATGEKVFQVSCNVLLCETDDSILQDKVNSVLAVFRSMGGAEAMVETVASFPIFTDLAVPNARAKERAKRVKTSNLADLLPFYGPWTGSATPSTLIRNHQGSLVKFDPFDSAFPNSNQLISGGSGSGKSYLCNMLLLQALRENPKIYFVDIGGSYRKFCENLGGHYLELGCDAGISINPFDLGAPSETVQPEKIKFLVGLIEIMTKEDTNTGLPKLIRAEIESSIQLAYARPGGATLTTLRELLLKHSDVEMRQIGKILGPWCGETLYGRFLDRPTSIKLDSSIICFDLKALENYPDLQTVCLYIITDLVWRQIQMDRGVKKFLVFDECWKLLKSHSGVVFIEEVFRTFRKYKASAIAISQDMDDFAKSKVSSALMSNCSIKWLLSQGSQSHVSETLGLNEAESEAVALLHQEKGRYSQTFLMAEGFRSVCLIESTPLEYWISTSDPRDLAALETLRKEEPDLSRLECLQTLSESFPFGVSKGVMK